MLIKQFGFRETKQLTSLVLDYLDEKESVSSFYNRFPRLENFAKQAQEKSQHIVDRSTLVEVLSDQYNSVKSSKKTLENIRLLASDSTFTVTTGHQLNLATGPLYFVYKILSTINLAEKLNAEYTDFKVVPVYWMATEDHDFAEINHFFFNSQKFSWDQPQEGKVGSISTQGLTAIWKQLNDFSNGAWHIEELTQLFDKAYQQPTLTEATRYLVNELFGAYGLVIVDADDARLKAPFVRIMKDDLIHHSAEKLINSTIKNLDEKGYSSQVNPREINLFYLSEQSRERIVKENNRWEVLNSSVSWSQEELLNELEKHPERFSPNVTLRPIYQEVILPNLAYLGGGAEVAYWFELKSTFDYFKVPYPMVMLRNMVLVLNARAQKKLEQLNLEIENVFLPKHELTRNVVSKNAEQEIDLTHEREQLEKLNEQLKEKILLVDKALLTATEAELTRRLKGLNNLEKKLIRAEKKKQEETMQRIEDLYAAVYPAGKVQERFENYSTLYAQWGRSFIADVKEALDPLDFRMVVVAK